MDSADPFGGQPAALFLSGPIGAGKTSLGRYLVRQWGGEFIEGDDHAATGKPWFASSLSTVRALLSAANAASRIAGLAVVAYPLRRREWVYLSRHLASAGTQALCVNLAVDMADLDAPARGRKLASHERRRSAEMIRQGYASRPFAALTLDTGRLSLRDCARQLRLAFPDLAGLPPAM
ncbi:hypothetical protein B5C34_08460 [Pacificimonas flava]|uniref:ATPase AAA-type core domain-containing protein n=2 Tax=Pacificimonas TaxID=1960290 RepID=A0A219B567_9SPHN|nr:MULTISPECIES: AAA family ATPase [Pacificimonas]MBZ6379305.1 AAA family ATPase [Pacificimonas aurantium]OWV33487.1 hypothetical protein B5C34_08460 [Pacificimonas flava]